MGDLLTLSDLPEQGALLGARLDECADRVARAAERSGRAASDVELLVVSKYVSADVIRRLWALGVRSFGENRVQQLAQRADVFASLEGASVHFIGHLQRNKVRKLADGVRSVRSIHSLDSTRLLEALEAAYGNRPEPAPDVWIEVNVSGEGQKTGLDPGSVPELALRVRGSRVFGAGLRGLMGMAELAESPEDARSAFRSLRELRDDLVAGGSLPPAAGLSMGMSQDFEIAIEEGATVVRIGSRLFS